MLSKLCAESGIQLHVLQHILLPHHLQWTTSGLATAFACAPLRAMHAALAACACAKGEERTQGSRGVRVQWRGPDAKGAQQGIAEEGGRRRQDCVAVARR